MGTGLTLILDRVKSYHPNPNLDQIKQAHQFACRVHAGRVHAGGGDFATHLLEVAQLVVELKLDDASICAALLYDVAEEKLATSGELKAAFGSEIADLVDGVTRLSQVEFTSREEGQAENFRKMLLAMNRDIRVILVKLADCLDDMRKLERRTPADQMRIARETMEIYAPLANRLGIFWLKAELEDLSFKYLYPEDYQNLTQKVAEKKAERETFIEEVCGIIARLLAQNHVVAEVKGRPKHFWSIYQKMRKKSLDYEEVYDRVGVRIIVENLPTCYEALGHIHSMWTPIQGRFKDYVAVPKPNSYQSLHTTVIGPTGEYIEIQIRTREMHEIAELGISAYWRYKEGGRGVSPQDEKKFSWLRQLVESQRYLEDSSEFLESIKVDLFSDEVFIYTPGGDVKVLAAGSTTLDFAYAVHSLVGHRCTGAKVNNIMVPLRHVLKNGDSVEILTSPRQHPSKDWLEFVQTSRAKSKIRAYVRREQQQRSLELGRETLERELRRKGLNYGRLQKNGELERVAAECKCNTIDSLLVHIGDNKIPLERVLEHLLPPVPKEETPAEAPDISFTKFVQKVSRPSSSGICIQGMGDILIRFARCCNPVPGDPIVGFITRGRGITVHHPDCRQVENLDLERTIEVYWESKNTDSKAVDLKIITLDSPGMLAGLSRCLTESGVNITRANCRVLGSKKAINSFAVVLKEPGNLPRVIRSLKKIEGVISVEHV